MTLRWLLLCFRLSIHFHCIIFSSFPSPHFPSADPSPVFSSDCQRVVIPPTAIFSICFSFPLPLLHFDLFAFSPLFSLPFSFSHLRCHFFPFCFPTVTLWPCSFPHPSSIQSSFLSCHHRGFFSSLPLIWPFVTFFMWLSALVFTSSIHLSIHFFPPVIFPHTLQLLFPFISLPNGSTSLSSVPSNTIVFPTCYCHNFTCSLPVWSLSARSPPVLFHPVVHLFLVFFLVRVSSALHPSFYSHSPPPSIIHSYLDSFFSHSNFVTVSAHQTVFIFLSLGHVIFFPSSPLTTSPFVITRLCCCSALCARCRGRENVKKRYCSPTQ